ncbi:MAG: hypothetical protein J0H52_20835, partial [Comamonadaceae bacterium]|nr:hypothetical protein [Comamonadaceae bacterium]
GAALHALSAFSVMGGAAALAWLPQHQAQQGAMACLAIAGGCSVALAARAARGARRRARARLLVRRLVAGELEAPRDGFFDPLKSPDPLVRDLRQLQERIAAIVRDVHAGTLAIATSSGHVGSDHARFAAMMDTLSTSIDGVNSAMERLTLALQAQAEDAERGRRMARDVLARAARADRATLQPPAMARQAMAPCCAWCCGSHASAAAPPITEKAERACSAAPARSAQ